MKEIKSENQRLRKAGLRPDELPPDENSGAVQKGDEATGSPAGGLFATGVGGVDAGDGSPRNSELEEEDPMEPQSGSGGGAVGGTPARKRSTGS